MPALTEDQRKLKEAAQRMKIGGWTSTIQAHEEYRKWTGLTNPEAILALLAQVEAAPGVPVQTGIDDATEACSSCGLTMGQSRILSGLVSPAVEQATSCTAPRHECMGQCPACQAGSGAGREP